MGRGPSRSGGAVVTRAVRGRGGRLARALAVALPLLASVEGRALDPARAPRSLVTTAWRDQLPHATVLAILPAPDGYLWLGTYEGLVRFDGVELQVFDRRTTPQLRSSVVLSLAADRTGAVWAGMQNGGLVRFQGGRVDVWTREDGLVADTVQKLFVDRAGDLWIGTGRGVQRMRRGALDRPGGAASFGSRAVVAFAQTPDGTIWAGGDGLWVLRAAGWARVPVGEGPQGAVVESLLADRDGSLWIGTSDGLARLAPGAGRAAPVDGAPAGYRAIALLREANDSLWIATNGGGIHRLRNGRFETIPALVRDGRATGFLLSLAQDREGSLWAGTRGGLIRLKDGVFEEYGPRDGLDGEIARTVFQDSRGRIWAGTDGGGLHYLDGERMVPVNARLGIPSERVRSLGEDGAGDLWVGTVDAGVVRVRGETSRRFGPAEGLTCTTVHAILGAADGTVWFGTVRGLYAYRDGSFRPEGELGGPAGAVYVLLEGRDGTLYAGTSAGGLLRRTKGVTSALTRSGGLAGNTVFALHEDADGSVWIGTDSGLSRLAKGVVTTWRSFEALAGTQVFSIEEDDAGFLWLGNNQGVHRIAKARLEAAARGDRRPLGRVSYGTADGMPSHQCNGLAQPSSLRARDGRIWFPTSRGFAVVDPSRLPRNLVPPPVVLQRVLVDGRRVPIDRPLDLEPGARRLEIGYAALSLAAPEHVTYHHRLEGLDEAWRSSSRRFVEYTTLPPGRYRFVVSAENADGVRSTEPAALPFRVRPRLGQRPAFWIALGALFVALAAVAYRLRIRALTQREERLRLEARRLAEAKEAAEVATRAKSAFLASMSHEIRTPLNAVLGFSQLLQGDPGLGARQREQLGAIRHSGEHLLTLLDDVLEMSKIEAGRQTVLEAELGLRRLLRDLETAFRLRTEARGLSLVFDVAPDVPSTVVTDEGKLRQALVHLLGNAVKYTDEGGVTVRVRTEQESGGLLRLLVDVEDTGAGIAEAELARLFRPFEQTGSGPSATSGAGLGLALSRGFARLLGGDVTATSRLGEGSVFGLSVPVSPVGGGTAVAPREDGGRDAGGCPEPAATAVPGAPSSLPALPEDLRADLRAAIVSADLEQVLAIARGLEATDPACACFVRDLAERFEYERLLALLAPAGEGDGGARGGR